ncbi:hypothetical protein POTOM_022484 [Populus tomentosa]|uniref:Uncharacterized protein n=1 Tax=Populus tomentosa TaxID=118781 RepID=A0A8X7ZRM9_POPTO|nr:hypothetical protein POTOM_022484 [Populus tomentosa]
MIYDLVSLYNLDDCQDSSSQQTLLKETSIVGFVMANIIVSQHLYLKVLVLSGHGLPFMEHGLDKQWRRIEEPIRSQAQEPRQIIQNQEMYWLKAATVSMEDIGGRSTEGTFNTIQKMELESSAIVNSGTK